MPLIKFSMDEVPLPPKYGSVPLLDLKRLTVGLVQSTMQQVFFRVSALLRETSRFGLEVQKHLPSPPLLWSLYIWSAVLSCAQSLPKYFASQVAFQIIVANCVQSSTDSFAFGIRRNDRR